MKRFLSELWASEAPEPIPSISKQPSSRPTRLRTLASKLVSPSSSEDEGHSEPIRMLPVASQFQSSPAEQCTDAWGNNINDSPIGTLRCKELDSCVRKHTACKSRASPRPRNAKRVCGQVRSAALYHNVSFTQNQAQADCDSLPEPYQFGSSFCIGRRRFHIPNSSDLDCCALADFQLHELSLIPNIKPKLILDACKRFFMAIWQHCLLLLQVQCMIQDFGNQVCIFKLGISSNLPFRVAQYMKCNFTEMRIIHCSEDPNIVAVLEVLLIAKFRAFKGCRN